MKITAIETQPVSIGVKPELSIVSSLGAHRVSPYVIVTVRDDAGNIGFGEATVMHLWSGETQDGAIAAINKVLAPVIIGRDPRDVAAAAAAMDKALIDNPFAKAAIEMALLDLVGKSLDVPAVALLGGARRPGAIPLKFSIGAFSPAAAANVAKSMAEKGFRAVKVKVGIDVEADVKRVAAIRSAMGESFPIGADANGGWNERQTIEALPHLERLGVNFLEQPLPRAEFRATARIRKRTSIPIMLDEGVFTAHHAIEAVRTEACDIISIYPGKNAGILRSMQIAQIADAAGLECVIGSNLEWDLATAAMLHTASAIPNLSTAVNHDIIGPVYHERSIAVEGIRYKEGCAVLPEGPGLGVNVKR
jgi:L-alanine-DL-glutamate epimerase-like enolase superfamily enzyme